MTTTETKTSTTIRDIAAARLHVRELKNEMKRRGVRIISCFNGGLTDQERSYNQQLFALKTTLHRLEIAS
jgi:hypothetical protein